MADTEIGPRVRNLTNKAQENYELRVVEYTARLSTIRKRVESLVLEYTKNSENLELVPQISYELQEEFKKYVELSDIFTQYLQRIGTEDSSRELASHGIVYETIKSKVNVTLKSIADYQQSKQQISVGDIGVKSEHSKRAPSRSGRSHYTSARSAGSRRSIDFVLEKRMKAQAEKARMKFAESEAELRIQEASTRIKLDLLRQTCKTAVAEAEYQAVLSDDEFGDVAESIPGVTERTKAYVAEQTSIQLNTVIKSEPLDHHDFAQFDRDVPKADSPHQPPHHFLTRTPAPAVKSLVNPDDNLSVSDNSFSQSHYDAVHGPSAQYGLLSPHVPPFETANKENVSTLANTNSQNITSEFTQFLLKKELLLSRLTHFNDKPETYGIWKTSFRNIMSELGVNPSEELDLLVKWLGPQSVKHATSLRASNATNPQRGLDRIWQRLNERYGSPEVVEFALKNKLEKFPKLSMKDTGKFYELSDILSEIESVKENKDYRDLLSYFDTSAGVKPVVSKLPYSIQSKWTTRAVKYKKSHNVAFPPFTEFVSFMREMSTVLNDPSFVYDVSATTPTSGNHRGQQRANVSAKKTGVSLDVTNAPVNNQPYCMLHHTNHSLNSCRAFRSKPMKDRKDFLKENDICYKCCNSTKHVARDCNEHTPCSLCKSKRHPTALHVDKSVEDSKFGKNRDKDNQRNGQSAFDHGGEKWDSNLPTSGHGRKDSIVTESSQFDTLASNNYAHNVTSKCTEICGENFNGKSCAKIVLVNVLHKDFPGKCVRTYCILDEQSNRSLARKELFDMFRIETQPEMYTLSSCAGNVTMSGRRSGGFIVESLNAVTRMEVPSVIECEDIPNNREEIPTPEVAKHYSHLSFLVSEIPELDPRSNILLLVGRDLMQAHHIIEQRIGSVSEPYAQKINLGWVIVGESCLDGVHRPEVISTMKTMLKRRPSIFQPCDNELYVEEGTQRLSNDEIGCSVFVRTHNDNKFGMSIEDKSFLKVMDEHCYKEGSSWVAPLPFRDFRPKLPNNRQQALYRARTLDNSLSRDPLKRSHFLCFMQELLDSGHAEIAPPLEPNSECWYLPLFGVYHPKKKDQVRGVFDSSAKFNGISLNDVLLSGPDLTNNLVGVLMRFRREKIAITADIKKMFYCFLVRPDHRNYLRFLWHKDNDLNCDLIDYRMKVHVFGNSPSPAVATYGLRKTVEVAESIYGIDVTEFVGRNFYVDDALSSHPTSDEAIDVLRRTQSALRDYGNLRLHKISSNSEKVLSAFPTEDLAKDLIHLDIHSDNLPPQRSLGLIWDIKQDVFKFATAREEKPFTRRGVLSVVNSMFDPLGFIAPVTIQGKLLLRKFMSSGLEWDETFQSSDWNEWNSWKESLISLENLQIPRTYTSSSPSQAVSRELHIFSDASEKAISAVSYLRVIAEDGTTQLGFVFGKCKVAPAHGHTIPRLELCATVLAVEVADFVTENLDLNIEAVKFYSDSRVALGYIKNNKRRFYVYVENRVERIRRSSQPDQWNYVPTQVNPADQGTRTLNASDIQNSLWLRGPDEFLSKTDQSANLDAFDLVDPDNDREVRPNINVSTAKTDIESSNLIAIGTQRYERFSKWNSLIRAISILKRFLHASSDSIVESYGEAERFVIKSAQHEIFGSEVHCLQKGIRIPHNSKIITLSPYLDSEGIMRVGGRLNKIATECPDKNPVILPGKHHVSTLVVRHYHEKVKHMGRHFTDGAIRSAGFWIVGVKRLISSVLHRCIPCRKRRANVQFQKMADLPPDRLEIAPPFTNVGLDVFGPWSVSVRKTRGGQANAKRWAIIFTCLVTRAVHLEVIEEMSSSAFINALRRVVAIRGNIKTYRSDRGSNFVGATDSLRIDAINVEDGPIANFLYDTGSVWLFNSPHSSHMGGVWERMIGVTRKILDSMLRDLPNKNLTHDVLVTLLAEVSGIINARPLVPVSTDPESPFVLSPATILTMKEDHSVKSFKMDDFNMKDLYKAQWRQVQCLANTFWSRWKREYLSTLQARKKWHDVLPNLKKGDVVLLKEKTLHRNEWPLGIIESAIHSDDNVVRKVEVRIFREGKIRIFTRPATEIVPLLTD